MSDAQMVPSSQQQPVAWRWRIARGNWHLCFELAGSCPENAEVQPLYPPPEPQTERVEKAAAKGRK